MGKDLQTINGQNKLALWAGRIFRRWHWQGWGFGAFAVCRYHLHPAAGSTYRLKYSMEGDA